MLQDVKQSVDTAMDALALDFGADELGPALASRLEALGRALVLHRRVDERLGHHRHRLGDALRELATLAKVPAEWLLRCRAVKVAGDRARHEAWSRCAVRSEKRVEDAEEPNTAMQEAPHAQPPVAGLAPGVWLESDQTDIMLGALGGEEGPGNFAAQSTGDFAQPFEPRAEPIPGCGVQHATPGEMWAASPHAEVSAEAFGQGVAVGWRLAVQDLELQRPALKACEKEQLDDACRPAWAAVAHGVWAAVATRRPTPRHSRAPSSEPSAAEGAHSDDDGDDVAEAAADYGPEQAEDGPADLPARKCLAERWERHESSLVDSAIDIFKQCCIREAEQLNCEATVSFEVITRQVQDFPKRTFSDSVYYVASWGESVTTEAWHYAVRGPTVPLPSEKPILFAEVLCAMLPKFVKQVMALGFTSCVHVAGTWQVRVAWSSPEPDGIPGV